MSDKSDQESGAAVAKPTKKKAGPEQKPKAQNKNRLDKLPPYNVILLDDNDHTYIYVIQMLQSVFGYAPEKGFKLAQEVDAQGRVIVYTTHKELAEMKRDQITAYGADRQIAHCKGSMTAIIEPAPK